MTEVSRNVRVRIEGPGAVAARMPAISGVVLVPRLVGWVTRPISSVLTRVRGEIVRAITSSEAQMSQCSSALNSVIEDAVVVSKIHNPVTAKADACKNWCVENRRDPIALQALCENKAAAWDSSIVSLVIEASAGFGEMGRSRLLGALAQRALQLQTALQLPDGVSRLLNAAQDLPWEAPGHEEIAKAVVALDKELFHGCEASVHAQFEKALGGSLADVVMSYASHPRIAVVEVVARDCEHEDALRLIAERAQDVYSIDPRMTYRLVTALAGNRNTTPEMLSPFADPAMWTKGDEERKALGALLQRVKGKYSSDAGRITEPSV